MIVDLILNRKYGEPYDAFKFYRECRDYNAIFAGIADGILQAMDSGTNTDVQIELVCYLRNGGYNPAISDYVNSVKWIDLPA